MLSKSKPRLLCVWEQGSNLGHLSHLRLPIEVALQQGFEVWLAARELHRVGDVLGGLPIGLLQAPFKQDCLPTDQASFLSYTHLLGQQCFSSSSELEMFIRAWRSIYDLVAPDIVLFEHSPTALVAAHAYAFKKVLVGSSFALPPVGSTNDPPFLPFPTTPRTREVWARLERDDANLLQVINAGVSAVGAPALRSLSEIYGQTQSQFLVTWPSLDQFGERSRATYLGVAPLPRNKLPQWPLGEGKKVFGYLQYFPSLDRLLHELQASRICALLMVRGLPVALRQAYTSEHIGFVDELVDLNAAAEQAAWVIHHGNHSTMSTFMLAGVPQLVIPRHQEQLFGALRLVSAGCAAMVFQDQTAFSAAIQAMQNNAQLKQSALHVASRCTPFDKERVSAYMRKTYLELLGNA